MTPDDLAHSVSHDLRANLRHITAYTGLVREELPPGASADLHKYLDTVTQAAQNLGRQLDGLMALIQVDQAAFHAAPVNLQALALEVDARIELLAPQSWPAVMGDVAMLRQILESLFANAIKFTQKTAQAQIQMGCLPSLNPQAAMATFFIKDNGAGFDSRQSDKLFRLFQRLHSSTEFEGLGVGLALTRKWVARHGGRVWAEAVPKVGCTVSFELPLALPSTDITNQESI